MQVQLLESAMFLNCGHKMNKTDLSGSFELRGSRKGYAFFLSFFFSFVKNVKETRHNEAIRFFQRTSVSCGN